MKTIILKYISLFLFILFSGHCFAQEKCAVKGNVTINGGDLNNVTVTLYKDSQQESVRNISKNGKFSYQLDFGYDYIFEFSKPEFVTKRISISTYVPQDVLERDSRFPPCKFSIELFRHFSGIDLSVFDQPIGMIMYNNETDLIEIDLSFQKEIEDELKRIERETKLKQQAYLAEQARINSEFNLAIKRGNNELQKKNYIESKTFFIEALKLKPEEVYPKDQISKIDNFLLSHKDELEAKRILDEKYNALILLADKDFTGANYEQAKVNYNSAISLKSSEKYPKEQLLKIKKLELELKNKAKRLLAEKALNDKYQAIITSADEAFELKEYETAKTHYWAALKVKRDEVYPKKQVELINEKLDNLKQLSAAKAKLVAEQKAKKAEYDRIIKLADAYFNNKDYSKAIASYEKALELDSEETYPQLQIEEINASIARDKELAANKAKEKEIDDKYKQFIRSGDKKFKAREYVLAKQNYTDALTLKPNEVYPKDQLIKIEGFMANQAKILADKKLLNEKYEALIRQADTEFKSEDYKTAIINYQSALNLKSKETYPKEQIKIANQALVKIAELEDKKLKDKKANQLLEEKYSKAISLGDSALNIENFKGATSNYTQALSIKKGDVYATAQLLKIKNLITEKEALEKAEALSLKKKAVLDKRFRSFVNEADKLFKNKKYTDALDKYEAAIQIVRTDAYVLKQIDLVKEKLEVKRLNEENRLALLNEYQAYIGKADKLFSQQKLKLAKDEYLLALKLKSKEVYPKSQIALIENSLAKQAKLDRKNKKVENEFNETLTVADAHFKKEAYIFAKHHYKLAQKIKPEDSYVSSKLKEIAELLKANVQSKEENILVNNSSTFGDNLLKKKEQEYKAFLDKGARAIKEKYLGKAKAYYKKALALFDREFVREKLAEVEKLKSTFKSEKERVEYEKMMSLGDKEFAKKNYSVARHYFKKAMPLATDRSVVDDKLESIVQAIESNKQELLDVEFNSLLKKGDDAFDSGNLSVAKFYYQKGLKIKPKNAQVKEKLKSLKKSIEVK